jgi:hypothetical protein
MPTEHSRLLDADTPALLGAGKQGVALALLLALSASCAATDEESAELGGPVAGEPSQQQTLEEQDELGLAQAKLDSSWALGPFSWSQGSAAKFLASASTHVCVLTKLQGDFDGGGEKVVVYQSGGNWYLGGSSAQSGIGGTAYCFAINRFYSANPSWAWHDADKYVDRYGTGLNTASAHPFLGDAITFINGFSGRLQYARDQIFVVQSSGPYTPNNAYAEMGRSGAVARNHFMSFYAGTTQGTLAKFWYNATYRADSSLRCVNSYGDYEVPMAPVNDAMCVFTQIGNGGNWDGGAERVDIYPKVAGGVETWYLRARSGYCGNERKTSAEARCFKRDQR